MYKLGILYGGKSTEHDASIKSEENFCKNLSEFDIVDKIFIDRDGNIFINNESVTCGELLNTISSKKDVFYLNLLHGTEGEDGEWSGIFDILNIRGSFENVLTSSLLMNKFEQSMIVKQTITKIKIPKSVIVNYLDNEEIRYKKILSLKCSNIILKPNSMGASHFTFHYNSIDKQIILEDLKKIFEYDDNVIVQEFINGEEYTCGVYNTVDGCITLPIIHVKANNQDFLDHKTKHNKGSSQIDFNNFKQEKIIKEISNQLFKLFNIKIMCRFDFIVSKNKIYFLEGNLIPGFSNGSAFPMMLKQANISLNSFIKNIIEYKNSLRLKNKCLPYEIND